MSGDIDLTGEQPQLPPAGAARSSVVSEVPYTREIDLTREQQPPAGAARASEISQFDYTPEQAREQTRGILSRQLLWILALIVGGVLFFVGSGRLEGTVLSQSIFPSLIALTGTALGFYFGAQTTSGGGAQAPSSSGSPSAPGTTAPAQLPTAGPVTPGGNT